jgi:hypothetical protein
VTEAFDSRLEKVTYSAISSNRYPHTAGQPVAQYAPLSQAGGEFAADGHGRDRGMITSARIEALKELDKSYAWVTALRAPAIRKLAEDDGPRDCWTSWAL